MHKQEMTHEMTHVLSRALKKEGGHYHSRCVSDEALKTAEQRIPKKKNEKMQGLL